MQVDDLDGRALLVIVRREEEPPDQPHDQAQHRQPDSPGQGPGRGLHELLRVGIFPDRHGASPSLSAVRAQVTIARQPQRRLTRSAAAAAKGSSAAAPAVIPASSSSGVASAMPLRAAPHHLGPEDQRGHVKRQDQQAEEQPAPPQPHRQRRPEGPDHRQRRRAKQQATAPASHSPPRGRFSSTPSTGATSVSGSPVTSQCASALTATTPSSGIGAVARRSSEPSSNPARRCGPATEGRPAAPPPTGCPARCAASSAALRPHAQAAPAPPRAGRTPAQARSRRPRAMASRRSRSRSAIIAKASSKAPPRAPAARARNGDQVQHLAPRAAQGRHAWRSAPSPPPPDAARTTPANSATEATSSDDGRLVQQPDRPPRHQQPRKAQPPLLPGRQLAAPAGRARRARSIAVQRRRRRRRLP